MAGGVFGRLLFGTVQKVHILSGAETFLRPDAQWPPDYIHMPKL